MVANAKLSVYLKVATRLVSIKKKITKTTERQTNYTEDIS